MYVSVHGEGAVPKGLAHHHRRRLVADAGQRLQLLKAAGHFAAVQREQHLAHCGNVLCLGGRQPQDADVFLWGGTKGIHQR